MTTTSTVGITSDALTTQLQSISETAMGKQDFLRLLIAQLKNQDPLAPMESFEFAAQLAQFSSVEQLTNISQTLDDNLNMDLLMTQAINNTLSITLIGREVVGIGNQVPLQEGNAQLHFKLAEPAQTVKLTITDSNGYTIRTITVENLTAGRQVVEWDGCNNNGSRVPDGTYTFSVTAYDGNGNQLQASPLVVGQATGVRYQNGTGYIVVNGQEIPFTDVIEISDVNQQEGNS